MAVTILNPPPNGTFSPDIDMQVSSNFIGPMPTGSWWRGRVLSLVSGIETEVIGWEQTFDAKTQFINWGALGAKPRATYRRGTASLTQGASGTLFVELIDGSSSSTVDQGSIPIVYSPTSSVPVVIQQASSTGQGLTPTEAQQLQETHEATVPVVSLDNLLLTPMSSGPVGGTVSAQLPGVTTGILVRIATIPPTLVSSTPDRNYFTPSLAVISLFRGSDLWHRVPVHTTSKLYYWFDQDLVTAAATLTLTQWMLNLSVQVAFRDGVTGQAFLLTLP